MLTLPIHGPTFVETLASPQTDYEFTLPRESVFAASASDEPHTSAEQSDAQQHVASPVFTKEDIYNQRRVEQQSALSNLIKQTNPELRASAAGVVRVFVFPNQTARDLGPADWAVGSPIEIGCDGRTEVRTLLQIALNHFSASAKLTLDVFNFEMRVVEGDSRIDFDFPAMGDDTVVCDIDTRTFAVVLKPKFANNKRASNKTTRTSARTSNARTTLISGSTISIWHRCCGSCAIL